MAKIFGIAGNITGKIANQVFAVVKGVNVVRQYNGTPENPQTPLQVASRARLKLLSQLAAAVDPLIAMKREGLKSSRNVFISKNYDNSSYNSQTQVAELALSSVDLTGGLVGMPGISIVSRTQAALNVQLALETADFDFVMWGGVIVDAQGRILTINPVRVDRQGAAPSAFECTFPLASQFYSGFVYAYGVRLNDDKTRTKYEQLTAAGANANLIVTSILREANVTASSTQSAAFEAYNE